MNQAERIQPGSTFTFTVTKEQGAIRLDKFLTVQFSSYSRSFLQNLITSNQVTINNKNCSKPGIILKENDVVGITFVSQVLESEPKKNAVHNVQIIAEHEHFLVLNKPAGLMMHKPNATSQEYTLVDWLTNHYNDIKQIGSIDRPGIVHRLDKDTSGVVVVARTNVAHTTFNALFMSRAVSKTYLALVHGNPDAQGTIDFPIGRALHYRSRMTAFSPTMHIKSQIKTRSAITHYRVIEYFDDYALVEAKPVTGRTHQIRAHLAALGHPLLGDVLYGGKNNKISRHALHAHRIEFNWHNAPCVFEAKIPEDFEKVLKILRQSKH